MSKAACPECGKPPVSAIGNASAGITILTCPDGHEWAETTWGRPS